MTQSDERHTKKDAGHAGNGRIALATLNAATPEEFADVLAEIFEYGRWIAEGAAARRPFGTREELHAAMCAVLAEAGEAAQVEFILGHPDLAGPRLDRSTLTVGSATDQRAAGLFDADPAIIDRLVAANETYRDRFGFSCIVCIRRQPSIDAIIENVERRTDSTREAQIAANLAEIHEISRLRLWDKVAGGWVSTHVLDTARGMPGVGMRVAVARRAGDRWQPIKTLTTNDDGRTDAPLLSEAELVPGRHEVRFHVGEYFARHGVETARPPYLDEVPVELNFGDGDAHYHVPLIVAPWGYSTYRGS